VARENCPWASLIEACEIDAHAPLATLLLHHDHVGEPGWIRDWLDEFGFQQAMHLGLGCHSFLIGHFSQSLLFRAHRGVDAQAVLDDGAADPDQIECGPGEDILVSGETGKEFFLVSRGQAFTDYYRLLRCC
jgi:hypothetical protein